MRSKPKSQRRMCDSNGGKKCDATVAAAATTTATAAAAAAAAAAAIHSAIFKLNLAAHSTAMTAMTATKATTRYSSYKATILQVIFEMNRWCTFVYPLAHCTTTPIIS